MSDLTSPATLAAREPVIRRIGIPDVTDSLAQGWRDFLEHPTQLFFLALIYPVAGLVLGYASSGKDLLTLVWPLVAGFALLGPIAALGIYEMSRRREKGLTVSGANAFDVLRSPSLGSIMGVALLLLVLFIAWLLSAEWIYRTTVGVDHPETLAELWRVATTTPEGRRLILVGNLVGFLFAVAALAVSVVSLPLLLDHDVGTAGAVRTSVRAVLANPAPMALWGLIVAGLLLLGSLPLLVGLAIVIPVLGHATWHLYRRTIG